MIGGRPRLPFRLLISALGILWASFGSRALAQEDVAFSLQNVGTTPALVVPAARVSSLDAFCAALGQAALILPGGQVQTEASWPSSSPRGPELEQRLSRCVEAGADSPDAGRTLHLRVDGIYLVGSLLRRRSSWFWSLFGESLPVEREERRVRLDAELRSYVAELAVRRPTNIVARAVRLPGQGYTAVTHAALLGFDSGELLLASRNRLDVVAIRPARGRLRARVVDSIEVPDALRPSFFGHESGSLTYFSPTDEGYYWLREQGPLLALTRSETHVLALGQTPRSPCPPRSLPLPQDCVRLADGRTYFESEMLSREGFGPSPHATSSFYGRFFGWVTRRGGGQQRVEVLVSRQGRVIASTTTAGEDGSDHVHTTGASGYGAAFAVTDIDHDGALEVLTSSSAALGEPDSLRLLRVSENGALHQVWTSDPLEGSVLIAGVADIDQDGLVDFVAVEERGRSAHLWVVR